jgi:hypothetical protein
VAALRAFLARCAAPPVAPIAPAEEPNVDQLFPNREVEKAGPDAALDVDLGPRIEALKSFLARYPLRDPSDEPPANAEVASSDAMPASSLSPAASVQPAHDSQVDASRVEPSAPPPSHAASASALPAAGPLGHAADLRAWFSTAHRRWIAAGIALVVFVALALAGLRALPSATAVATGALTVNTNPAGISVLVDGTPRGVTPFSVDLPPGDHVVELVTGSERRRIPVSITAGGQVSHFLELPRVEPGFGDLLVRTEPPGVSVSVDGRAVGRSPLTVRDLTPGSHAVVLNHESGSVTERVLIESGRTSSLVSTANPAATAAAGWISIKAPADVQVYEDKRLLGSSRIDRIMLPVGRHDLEIVNESLGYRASRSVQVTAGQVSPVTLEWPKGSLALNAIPWAEVWVDGQLIGDTPIGNVSLPIGEHEVIFRHPELGERRSSVIVTMGKVTKIGIDLGAK